MCPPGGGGRKLPLVSLAKSLRGERRLLEPAPMRQAKSLVWLRGLHLTYLLPWRLVEWEMAGPGRSGLRPPLMTNSGETGLRSITSQSPGDVEASQHFPSHSKMKTGGVPRYSSSTNMQESNHGPA